MFIKTFLKKNTTRQYIKKVFWLVIITCVANLIFLLVWNFYKIDLNKKFDNMYLSFYVSADMDIYNQIANVDNVNDLIITLYYHYNEFDFSIIGDTKYNLKYNEIIIDYNMDYDIGDIFVFEDYRQKFILKDKLKNIEDNIYMNKNAIYDMAIDLQEQIAYNVYVDDWTQLQLIIDQIDVISGYEVNNYVLAFKDINNYDMDVNIVLESNFVIIYNVVRVVVYAILIIYLIYLLCGIYAEETKNNYLYYILGFPKSKIHVLALVKMLIVTIVTLILLTLAMSFFGFLSN
ncbi:MAG TPA: hypothetical protein IAB40_00310 [Candidatus Onthocola stercoravium]|nr:hypothetical protein [Candidatus Onthocola stercoravium]